MDSTVSAGLGGLVGFMVLCGLCGLCSTSTCTRPSANQTIAIAKITYTVCKVIFLDKMRTYCPFLFASSKSAASASSSKTHSSSLFAKPSADSEKKAEKNSVELAGPETKKRAKPRSFQSLPSSSMSNPIGTIGEKEDVIVL